MGTFPRDDDRRDHPVYLAALGAAAPVALVHHATATMNEVVGQRDDYSPEEMWNLFFRRSLRRDGLLSEIDFESKLFAEDSTLDDFVLQNQHSYAISQPSEFSVVDTGQFQSPQDACSSIANCKGWWRFTRVGYNSVQTEAMLHSDFEHPRYGSMGVGQFNLLHRVDGAWRLSATHMTWVS